MKQEQYIKVVDDVVRRMQCHADVVMNVEQVARYLGLSVGVVYNGLVYLHSNLNCSRSAVLS